MSILDRTENLIDLYVYAQGVSKIPRHYHMWGFISLMAACLQDRVWIEEVVGQPLFPNMYIVLWGDSGSGKSIAIRSVFNLTISDPEFGKFINAKHGRGTFQSIADMMGKTNRKNELGLPEYEQPKMWWTMDEVANDVGDGPRANDFIKGITELYYCPPSWTDSSRTYGLVELTKPVFNWLAGSTPEWYASTVKRDGVEGGFQPRTLTVHGYVDYNPGGGRQWPPVYPKDREEVMTVVAERLRWLCKLPVLSVEDEQWLGHVSRSGTGAFTLHEDVASKLEEWNYNRVAPLEGLEAYWNQTGVKLKKLMMVLSVAERSDLLITPDHWRRARAMLRRVEAAVPSMLKVNYQGSTMDHMAWVEKFIQKKQQCKHSELLSYLSSKGIHLKEVRDARKHLFEMGQIDYYTGSVDKKTGEITLAALDGDVDRVKRGLWYKWRGEGGA